MQKDRGFRIIAVVALVFAVAGLTIAYANYSTNLVIQGNGGANGNVGTVASSWDVHFEYLNSTDGAITTEKNSVALTGYAEDAGTATIAANTTTISGIDFTLKAGGDSAAYKFLVANDGDIKAKISAVTGGKLTCTSTVEAEAQAVCDKLSKTLTYTDGGAAVAVNDELVNSTSKGMTLKFDLASDFSTQLTADVDVSMSDITITYAQK